MADEEAKPGARPQGHPLLVRAAAVGVATVVAAGLAGEVVRDRSAWLGVMMYVPLVVVGVAAIAIDVSCRGRSLGLPRARFALAVLGGVGIAAEAIPMIGTGASSPGGDGVRVLQWNVQWGGGPGRNRETWASQWAEILRRAPDIVVLSEAPPDDWISPVLRDLGPDASSSQIAHEPGSRYWFRLVVCSRWPTVLQGRVPLTDGSGMSVEVQVPGRRLRVLVVDGPSDVLQPRAPFLKVVAEACDAAQASGHPFDFVVGDFNSPSRSVGFDALFAREYALASRSARGWRGTFPAHFPLYDIDHVWVAPGLCVAACVIFRGPYGDHRGQIVRVFGIACRDRRDYAESWRIHADGIEGILTRFDRGSSWRSACGGV